MKIEPIIVLNKQQYATLLRRGKTRGMILSTVLGNGLIEVRVSGTNKHMLVRS